MPSRGSPAVLNSFTNRAYLDFAESAKRTPLRRPGLGFFRFWLRLPSWRLGTSGLRGFVRPAGDAGCIWCWTLKATQTQTTHIKSLQALGGAGFNSKVVRAAVVEPDADRAPARISWQKRRLWGAKPTTATGATTAGSSSATGCFQQPYDAIGPLVR